MAVGKAGRYKNWPEGDVFPKTWEEWEELTDTELFEMVSAMAAQEEIEAMQFVLHALQRRENERSNRTMKWLMVATVVLAAISALFVGLAAFEVI